MNDIKPFDMIVTTKTMNTRECPSVPIKEGTKGTVLELVKNKNGETEYLVELDNSAFDEIVVTHFRRDEIRRVDN